MKWFGGQFLRMYVEWLLLLGRASIWGRRRWLDAHRSSAMVSLAVQRPL